jgi:hypothetical protein
MLRVAAALTPALPTLAAAAGRSEIPEKHTWNPADLFPTSPSIRQYATGLAYSASLKKK